MKKKVAIVGAGFFGLTAALFLNKKHNVIIYEKTSDILNQSSKVNQLRFHFGYHYPRSRKTVKEIKKNAPEFMNFYKKKNIFGKTINYYGIARHHSKITFDEFKKFLKKEKLFSKKNDKFFPKKFVSGSIISREKNLNYFKFKKYLKYLIKKHRIKIKFKTQLSFKDLKKYDKIILTAYSSNSSILKSLKQPYNISRKYELVEKTLIQLPKLFKNKSFIILDGKFLNIDPFLGTKYHLLSSNKYSKIEVVRKKFPIFKSTKRKLCNDKIYKHKNKSVFSKIIKNQSKYMPFISNSKYIGSMYVVRALSSNFLKNDERVTNIRKINDKFYSVLGGKWNTCVSTAKYLAKII